MRDQFDRTIDYMRISITDRCNLRCKYCMPDGVELTSMDHLLTLEEIVQCAKTAAGLGIHHIKLTGGELLVRRGATDLVRMLKQTEGIDKVTLTTNGLLLPPLLPGLIQAGLDAVNISLDTTDPEKYKEITGADELDAALQALDRACESGIRTKVNAVSLDLGEENLWNLAELAKDRPLDVRFIEMMPIGLGKKFPVLDHRHLMELLKHRYPSVKTDSDMHGFGPAVYYHIPGWQGSVGLISAIHGKFCDTCNRVRLTSQGYLKTCLCYQDGADLRAVIRSGLPEQEKESALRQTMRDAIFRKPRAHCFDEPDQITEDASMNAIGG